jgi:hypothetical protein
MMPAKKKWERNQRRGNVVVIILMSSDIVMCDIIVRMNFLFHQRQRRRSWRAAGKEKENGKKTRGNVKKRAVINEIN